MTEKLRSERHGDLTLVTVRLSHPVDGGDKVAWEILCRLCDTFIASGVGEKAARATLANPPAHGRRCACGYEARNCADLAAHLSDEANRRRRLVRGGCLRRLGCRRRSAVIHGDVD